MGKQEEISKKIIDLLRLDTRGLSIQEIAEKIKTSRITASIALAKLEGQGDIDTRKIGNCKLHYLKEKGGRK